MSWDDEPMDKLWGCDIKVVCLMTDQIDDSLTAMQSNKHLSVMISPLYQASGFLEST